MTNYPPANLGTTSDEHTPITRNDSFGSKHDSPPVSPHAPNAKPRTVCSYNYCFKARPHKMQNRNTFK